MHGVLSSLGNSSDVHSFRVKQYRTDVVHIFLLEPILQIVACSSPECDIPACPTLDICTDADCDLPLAPPLAACMGCGEIPRPSSSSVSSPGGSLLEDDLHHPDVKKARATAAANAALASGRVLHVQPNGDVLECSCSHHQQQDSWDLGSLDRANSQEFDDFVRMGPPMASFFLVICTPFLRGPRL